MQLYTSSHYSSYCSCPSSTPHLHPLYTADAYTTSRSWASSTSNFQYYTATTYCTSCSHYYSHYALQYLATGCSFILYSHYCFHYYSHYPLLKLATRCIFLLYSH